MERVGSHSNLGPDLGNARVVKTHPAEDVAVVRQVVVQANPNIQVTQARQVQTGPTRHVEATIMPDDHPTASQNLFLGKAEKPGMFAQTNVEKYSASARIEPAVTVESAQRTGHRKLDLKA